MFVGILTIDIHIPENDSLKWKRHVLQSIKDRVRNNFNVSISEVDNSNLWQRTTIGVAVISNDRTHINQTLQGVISTIDRIPSIEIIDYRIEMM
ncbi:MAG: DUF503 domain-containing protein [Nitrospirota bacterium]